jgi:protein-tyrosine phosphatase
LKTVHAPVFQDITSPAGLADGDFPGFAAIYAELLGLGTTAYRILVETIAETEGGVLFHCAAGKDRTGVGSALLLSIADVLDDEITADYHRTETVLNSLREQRVAHFREQGISEERIALILSAPREAMQATIDVLQERYGGAEGYLVAAGTSRDAVSAARARMVG